MSFKRLLSRNPDSGVERWMHHDGERIGIETRQDVTKALDQIARVRNSWEGYRDDGEHHHHRIAHIPNVVIDQWLTEDGIDVFNPDHADRVWKKLNDPDWKKLRTSEGWV